MMTPLKVVELFAGIGAQASALERLGIPFESTVCEIDPHAYNAYCAIHGPTPNLGDITEVEHLPDCDLLTYSFPCQDLSIAGLQRGMAEGSGTRSSLLWEVERLLTDAGERERLPEVLLMENVDAILNKENKPHLDRFIAKLNRLGYETSYAVLNAKDYGVPQNRKRCFMVSTLTKGHFNFPQGFPLQRILLDVLEDEVDDYYYLSEEKLATFESHRKRHEAKGNGFGVKLIDPERESGAYSHDTPIQGLGELCDSPSESQEGPGMIIVGQLHDTNYDKMNRVYSVYGVSPVIEAARGGKGGHTPKIEVTGLVKGNKYEMDQRVHSPEGIAPTVCTRGGD